MLNFSIQTIGFVTFTGNVKVCTYMQTYIRISYNAIVVALLLKNKLKGFFHTQRTSGHAFLHLSQDDDTYAGYLNWIPLLQDSKTNVA